jgi:hypothetical protein
MEAQECVEPAYAQTQRGMMGSRLEVDIEDCVGAPVKFRQLGFLTQPGTEAGLALQEQHWLAEFAENHDPVNEEALTFLHRRRAVPGRRDHEATDASSVDDSNQVAASRVDAQRLGPSLHFNQVYLAVKFDHAVDLLSSLAVFQAQREQLPDANSVQGEDAVEEAFQFQATLVRVLHAEEVGDLRPQVCIECAAASQLVPGGSAGGHVGFALSITFLPHAREGVLHADDVADLRDETAGLELVAGGQQVEKSSNSVTLGGGCGSSRRGSGAV